MWEFHKTLPSYPDIGSPGCMACGCSDSAQGFVRLTGWVNVKNEQGVVVPMDAFICVPDLIRAANTVGCLPPQKVEKLHAEYAPLAEENERLTAEIEALRDTDTDLQTLLQEAVA